MGDLLIMSIFFVGALALIYGVIVAARATWPKASILVRLSLVLAALWAGTMANLVVLASISGVRGGTVENDQIVNGEHFLGSNGRYRKVSPNVYRTMSWYGQASKGSVACATALLAAALAAVKASQLLSCLQD